MRLTTCYQLCVTCDQLITRHFLLVSASVSIWHHIQQTFYAVTLFWTLTSFCYIRQSFASCASYCVSVEVKMVVCWLSWKRFEKYCYTLTLLLTQQMGMILTWKVAWGLLEICEKPSAKVCWENKGKTKHSTLEQFCIVGMTLVR